MLTFKVIDIMTGREVSADKIEEIAKENGLMDMDIDQFFVGEDGELILMDDCGNAAYCDRGKLLFEPVLNGKYPDLNYMEFDFTNILQQLYQETFTGSHRRPQVELVAMFPQTWPNTAGGFSEPGMVAGQAFTTQFTTVMRVYVHDTEEEYYGVFFGNKPAYIVDHANETFFEDLKNRQIKSKYEAGKVY